ncbi:CPBP family intramembrane glutamic endopeptidase [Actinoplanes sp. NPDC023801]|uniref:CPBP family intramembrane glutamic endopeptidase n=1 Tax=Actinoplanes sp. NPDC023801 TaxID=3154595 RepID=UPI003403C819
MADRTTIYSYALIVIIYGFLLVNTGYLLRRGEQALVALLSRPGGRAAFYRNGIVNLVLLGGLAAAAVALHPRLTFAGTGLAWPRGGFTDWFFSGLVVFMLVVLYRKARAGGQLLPTTLAMLPRTGRERWLAGGAAVAFGAGEEILYRGLLLAVGTEVLGLPMFVAAIAAWVLFVAAHAYQQWQALFTVGYLGALFTVLYLESGSLLLPIVLHVLWDLVVLLLIRPTGSGTVPVPEPLLVTLPEPDPESASVAEALPQTGGGMPKLRRMVPEPDADRPE